MGKNLNRHPQLEVSDEIKEYWDNDQSELPEGTEEITKEEAEELEKEVVNSEPVDEQQKYANKKASYEEEIKQLTEINIDLNKKAEEIEHTVDTFCLESIYGMENFIKQAIKTYTDRNDIKEIKNEIKNLETVFAFEQLLSEYKILANEHRANITANNNDIKNYQEQIKELEEKITCFQTKLQISNKSGAEETAAQD